MVGVVVAYVTSNGKVNDVLVCERKMMLSIVPLIDSDLCWTPWNV